MRPDERDSACLWDMLVAAREAYALIESRDMETIIADRMRLLALERTIEITGEAARRISPEFQAACVEIEWRGLIGLRTVLAHDYGRINHRLLIDTAVRRLPGLITVLEALVGDDFESDSD
jgi:uncharacterized protein with HEPN domain